MAEWNGRFGAFSGLHLARYFCVKTFVVGATIQCDFYGWTMIFGGFTISYWRQVGRDR